MSIAGGRGVRAGVAAVAALCAAALLVGCDSNSPFAVGQGDEARLGRAIASVAQDDELARFYKARGGEPLWVRSDGVRPEARTLVRMIAAVPVGVVRGADARTLRHLERDAGSGDPDRLARLEVALSSALVSLDKTLHAPISRKSTFYVGPPPQKALTATQLLNAAAQAPSLHAWLVARGRVNPLQLAYLRGLHFYQAQWSRLPQDRIDPGGTLAPGDGGPRVAQLARRLGQSPADGNEARFDARLEAAVRAFQSAHGLPATGIADAGTVGALNRGSAYYERLVRANLDRAGALPLVFGSRYVLVNSAAQELYAVEDGRVRDRMRVIVGKAGEPTPDMVAALRFLVVNPYWNVPPDLAAKRAARVVREGYGVIEQERLQLLSGWEGDVRELRPEEVDWPAVASGRKELRMRQRPGGDNMMGRVKFMAPNRLGIYLHDTPMKAAFALPDRRLSAGCVRVEDAPKLARWLTGAPSPLATNAANQKVDLPRPVPLYIGYFTAVPNGGRIAFRSDIYRRDPALMAQLDGEGARVASAAR